MVKIKKSGNMEGDGWQEITRFKVIIKIVLISNFKSELKF
jgi:hypothetical protein